MIQQTFNRAVVLCDGCGREIKQSGYMCAEYEGSDRMTHWCDDCSCGSANQEFRVCMKCGMPMVEGFTDEVDFYACDGCFDDAMHDYFGEYHEVEDDALGGHYVWYEPREGKWYATGVYWTTWY